MKANSVVPLATSVKNVPLVWVLAAVASVTSVTSAVVLIASVFFVTGERVIVIVASGELLVAILPVGTVFSFPLLRAVFDVVDVRAF